jgi:hypothetical protein
MNSEKPKRVYHPVYGEGELLRTRNKGFEALIEFDRNLRLWIRTDELKIMEEPSLSFQFPVSVPSKQEEGIKTIPSTSKECFKARRIIEALRLGIVPTDCITDFTFGRDREISTILDWLHLKSANENVLFLFGEYGLGKTHLLHYIAEVALKKGFATAIVELDHSEVPLFKPKRVFNRIALNFKYISPKDGKLKGFREFMEEVFWKGGFEDHFYFGKINEHLNKFDEKYIWEWIECRESYPRPLYKDFMGRIKEYPSYSYFPPLYEEQTAANIYCYLISGLGWAAVNLLGLRGFLVEFDEAESIDIARYYRQLLMGRNLLKALMRIANNDESLIKKPSLNLGLDYCAIGEASRIPFLYRIPSGLKLVFAFTHTIQEREDVKHIVELSPLSENAKQDIMYCLKSLYEKAYSKTLQIDIMQEQLANISGRDMEITRFFTKGVVEYLDLERLKHKL